MKILLIGLGSAGQRHLRNLKRLLGEEAPELLAYRVRKLKRTFDDSMSVVEGMDVSQVNHIMEYEDLDKALEQKPDIAIIANPNSMHMQCALKAAEAGCDLFIEKPLSSDMDGIEELRSIVSRKGLIAYVGYQNRLNPCVRKMKEVVDSETLGKIFHVNCEVGELLTRMHKYENYQGMNESRKETGGGVVVCQIHELDYLYWIFGMPSEVYSIGGKNSSLDIDVEDNATSIFRFGKKDGEFPVVVHQDFIQYPPVRKCKVIGEKGRIEIDLLNCSYTIYDENGLCESSQFKDFQRNDMFVEEMRMFLECVRNRTPEFVDIAQAEGSLKMALALKESIRLGKSVKIS